MASNPDQPRREALLALLGVQALVLLPHLYHLPWWAPATALLCMAWSALRLRQGRKLPGTPMRLLLVAAGTLATLLWFHSLNGREAGVTLLVLMLGLKALELRGLRDALFLLFIDYFLVATQFLWDQSLPLVLYLLLSVILLTAVLMALNDPHGLLPPRSLLRRAAGLTASALPIMLLLFLLFPRLPGPLWGLPAEQGGAARSGLGEEMRPGDIARLVRSDTPAFRVRFDGPLPPQAERYWRGPVLDHFDGRRWTRGRPEPRVRRGQLELDRQGPHFAYRLWPVDEDQRWVTPLPYPVALPPGLEASGNLEFRVDDKARHTGPWQFSSYTRYRLDAGLDPAMRQRNLQLPPDTAPRARALAHSWRQAAGGDDMAVVRAALALYREQPFHYTLRPPLLPGDAVDGFLFGTRKGFCEHYAGSFVVLMRAAGIPARVVTGYQGGEYNALGDYLLVRQSDAHAWAEVWLEGRGWVRVDPTAAVAPERIERGVSAALGDAGEALPLLLGSRYGNNLLNRLRMAWDSVGYYWDAWVLGFGPERQAELLARLGLERLGWRALILLLVAGVLGSMLLLMWLSLRRSRTPPAPLAGLERDLRRRLARLGVAPRPGEGLLALQRRLEREAPALAQQTRALVQRLLALRYGEAQPHAGELARLRRQARRLAWPRGEKRHKKGPHSGGPAKTESGNGY